MRDRLPSIQIVVANPRGFLDSMAAIAGDFDFVTVSRSAYGSSDKGFAVILRLIGTSPYRNSSAALSIVARSEVNVHVVTGCTDSPSYEIFCATAKAIIKPLLTVYNRKEHSRCRMKIASKERLEPKLTERQAKVFKYFTASANKSNLNHTDWRRFYEFVRVCRDSLSANDLAFLLVKDGFPEEYALHIVEIYEHLRDFMRPRSEAEAYDYYHVVKGWRWPNS